MTPELTATDASIAELSCDAVVVGAYAGDHIALADQAEDLDGKLDGRLMEHLRSAQFEAKPGEVVSMTTLGALPARTIVVAGLGGRSSVAPKDVRRAAAAAAKRIPGASEVACALPSLGEEGWSAAAEGFSLASYRFDGYKCSFPARPHRRSSGGEPMQMRSLSHAT